MGRGRMTGYVPALIGVGVGVGVATLAGIYGGVLVLDVLGHQQGGDAFLLGAAAAALARVSVPLGCWLALWLRGLQGAGATGMMLLVLTPVLGLPAAPGRIGLALGAALPGAAVSRFLVLALLARTTPVRPGGEGCESS